MYFCFFFFKQTDSGAVKSSNRQILKDTISYKLLGQISKNEIVLSRDVNLGGKVCRLPHGLTIVSGSGCIRNGTLIGNATKIKSSKAIFDKVTIKGTWDVPLITTRLFSDLRSLNALKNVVALANPKVNNTIIIEEGDYLLAAKKDGDACLNIVDNTDMVINGTIRLTPNNYQKYEMIRVKGCNVRLSGKGSIIGDKFSHTGYDGEWGMGVKLYSAQNTSIRGLTIKECWGDCIYISGNSRNVLVENCKLKDSRRQGISITKADSVIIRNCQISNISGTFPQYAIDIEPNKGKTCDNILIDRVDVSGCEGGFRATVGKKGIGNARIGKVKILNCHVSAKSRFPIHLNRCEQGIVKGCVIDATNDKPALFAAYVDDLVVMNNIVSVENQLLSSIKNVVKEFIGKGKYATIRLVKTTDRRIESNQIIER